MGEFDSSVECGSCNKAYTEAALQYDPEKQAKLQDEHLSILISHAQSPLWCGRAGSGPAAALGNSLGLSGAHIDSLPAEKAA